MAKRTYQVEFNGHTITRQTERVYTHFIQDECDGNQRSVTNGAEDVVPIAVKSNPTYRLFYRDTEGQWDELVHDAGKFVGFAPGKGIKP